MNQPDDGADRSSLNISEPHPRPAGPPPNRNGGRPASGTTRPSRPGAAATVVRSWRFVLVGALLGALLGAIVGAVVPEEFEVSAYLVVTAEEDADAGTTPTSYAQVYSRLARQPAVMMQADPEAQLGTFGQGITVRAFPDAPMIELTGSGDSAELATLRANTMAEALGEYSEGEAAISGYAVDVVTPALEEGATSPPTMLPSVAAGVVLGVFAGLVLAMIAPRRSRRR